MHHKELEMQDKVKEAVRQGLMKPGGIYGTKEYDNILNAIALPSEVNHPKHYASGKIECIDAIEACMSKEAFKGLLKGSILQYVWRYENKGGLTDLQKAQWYLDRLIKNVTNN